MHPAQLLPHRAVNIESLFHFRRDIREMARLHPSPRLFRVAVHRALAQRLINRISRPFWTGSEARS
jgi:hypothetical protein